MSCDPSALQQGLIDTFLSNNKDKFCDIEWKNRWLRVKLNGSDKFQDIAEIRDHALKQPLVELDKKLWRAEHECCTCETLIEKFQNHPPLEKFFPYAFYNSAGDQIDVCWENESYYAESVYDKYGYWSMSLDRSQEDRRIVGCSINSISAILRNAGYKLVKIENEE